MPYALTEDGVELYYEDTGSGSALLFVHEFAGDCRSWEPQVRHFSRRYRCITYNARGYPPSTVSDRLDRYSQPIAVADAVAVLDHLGVDRAHVVGLSMGSFCALHLGLRHPDRALSLVLAGCGYGADPEIRERFRAECEELARAFETDGSGIAERYASGPTRVPFRNKDPRGWREFATQLGEHSALGSALTLRGVQRERPSLYDLRVELAALAVPTLVVAGDEDEPSLDASVMLKRTIPTAGLAVLPRTGHTMNLEEPEAFNRAVGDFLAAVEVGRWSARDPDTVSSTIMGLR